MKRREREGMSEYCYRIRYNISGKRRGGGGGGEERGLKFKKSTRIKNNGCIALKGKKLQLKMNKDRECKKGKVVGCY